MGILTATIIEDWLHFVERTYTQRTHEHYSMIIKRFSADAPKTINEISIEHIENYIDKILKHHKRRTANSHLTAIKSFTHWYSDRYNIPNPAKAIKMLTEDPPKQRVISPDEYKILLSVAEGIEKAIVEFFGNTGIRRGEFLTLKSDDISPDLKFLRVLGKGRKQRIVPLNNTCRQILTEYKNNGELEITKRYPSKEGLYYLCRKLYTKAKLEPFGLHALRHYFCTELIKKKVPLILVSKILGHSSVKITESVYVHLVPEIDLAGITDVLD